jgi:hypothetical protein
LSFTFQHEISICVQPLREQEFGFEPPVRKAEIRCTSLDHLLKFFTSFIA